MIESFTLASFGILILGNVAYILWFTISSCKENRRLKRLAEANKLHQENINTKAVAKAKSRIPLQVIKEEDEDDAEQNLDSA